MNHETLSPQTSRHHAASQSLVTQDHPDTTYLASGPRKRQLEELMTENSLSKARRLPVFQGPQKHHVAAAVSECSSPTNHLTTMNTEQSVTHLCVTTNRYANRTQLTGPDRGHNATSDRASSATASTDTPFVDTTLDSARAFWYVFGCTGRNFSLSKEQQELSSHPGFLIFHAFVTRPADIQQDQVSYRFACVILHKLQCKSLSIQNMERALKKAEFKKPQGWKQFANYLRAGLHIGKVWNIIAARFGGLGVLCVPFSVEDAK
jgi:hypothetical protein